MRNKWFNKWQLLKWWEDLWWWTHLECNRCRQECIWVGRINLMWTLNRYKVNTNSQCISINNINQEQSWNILKCKGRDPFINHRYKQSRQRWMSLITQSQTIKETKMFYKRFNNNYRLISFKDNIFNNNYKFLKIRLILWEHSNTIKKDHKNKLSQLLRSRINRMVKRKQMLMKTILNKREILDKIRNKFNKHNKFKLSKYSRRNNNHLLNKWWRQHSSMPKTNSWIHYNCRYQMPKLNK